MDNQISIRRAQSCSTDARQAAREFHAGVTQPDMALVIFFCSSEYDLKVLAEEMSCLFTGVQIAGCTTAGEIGPAGYREHSLTGASFPASSFDAACGRIGSLQQFTIATGQTFVQEILQRLDSHAPHAEPDNSFALLLIDGLSMREEVITRALQSSLGSVPMVGGSAGDDVKFEGTHVYFDGRFHSDSAILILAATRLPFTLFKTQHFVATGERLVVTEADTTHRIVNELNGLRRPRSTRESWALMCRISLPDGSLRGRSWC